MQYVLKQQFSILDLAPGSSLQKTVGVVESEDYLARLYIRHLERSGFSVYHCPIPGGLSDFVYSTTPDLLVLNHEIFPGAKSLAESLRLLIEAYPRLLVVTVGYDTDPEELKHFMSAGVSSHMNRKLSRPQDLAVIVKNLLNRQN